MVRGIQEQYTFSSNHFRGIDVIFWLNNNYYSVHTIERMKLSLNKLVDFLLGIERNAAPIYCVIYIKFEG